MATKHLLLAGGGEADDSRPLDELFAEWTGYDGRMLYLPMAMDGTNPSYADCLKYIQGIFRPLGIMQIDMWTDFADKNFQELAQYDSIFIGGGNTFRLLDMIRKYRFDQTLIDFINRGGAGAIILGQDIMTCAHMDANDAEPANTRGLNVIGGHSVWCHYQPDDEPIIREYVNKYRIPVLAMSEKSGMRIEGDLFHAWGFEPAFRFEGNNRQVIEVGTQITA